VYFPGWPDGAICRQKGVKLRSEATFFQEKIAPFFGDKKFYFKQLNFYTKVQLILIFFKC